MNFTFVDVETTGSRMTYDRVIEIGMLRVENGEVVKTYERLINPEIYLSPFIEQMTGISATDLENAPTFEELKEEISEMLDDSIFVAHNVRFDYGFLKNEFNRYGMPLSLKQLCTVKLSRVLYPQYRKHNLDALIERFNFSCERRHRALDDAKVLWDFYQIATTNFESSNLDAAVTSLIRTPSIPTLLDPAEIDRLPEQPGVYIFYGENGLPLYVGKSTNIKDRVLSHFTNDYTSTKEMNMVQQLTHIETITTAGELGALMKESDLIKKMQPIYNRQLRQTKKLTLLKKTLDEKGYHAIDISEVECITADEIDSIIGIFKSQKQAKEFIRAKAAEHELCEKLLGLEKGSGSCFGYKIERCRGTCIEKEPAIAYNIRFIQAFFEKKIKSWPFAGPIKIVEHSEVGESTDEFLVDRWCLLSADSAHELKFDTDLYRILVRYLYDPKNRKHIKPIDNQQHSEDYIE